MNPMNRNIKSFWVLLSLLSVLCFLMPLSLLQAQDRETQPAQQEMVRNNLQPFAGAYKQISQIYTDYEQRIIQSNGSDQADALQQEANEKMNQAVADHGLSVEDYNTIFRTIQNDPGLKEEFLVVLQKTR